MLCYMTTVDIYATASTIFVDKVETHDSAANIIALHWCSVTVKDMP